MSEIESKTTILCTYGGSCDMLNAIIAISAELKRMNSNVQIELINEEFDGYEMVQFTKFK